MKTKRKWQYQIFNDPGFKGKIIAISEDEIIYSGSTYQEVIDNVKTKKYSLFKVPENIDSIRIIPLKIKSLKKHPWIPAYPIGFFKNDLFFQTEEMLIDSGADISVVNYEFGLLLGFEKTKDEVSLEAEGIGGSVSYLLRKAKIQIDDVIFDNTFAWLQDDKIPDMIIGRETVFDMFDIEFKQADEIIIFRKR